MCMLLFVVLACAYRDRKLQEQRLKLLIKHRSITINLSAYLWCSWLSIHYIYLTRFYGYKFLCLVLQMYEIYIFWMFNNWGCKCVLIYRKNSSKNLLLFRIIKMKIIWKTQYTSVTNYLPFAIAFLFFKV